MRYALRSLLRRPGYTGTAVLVLASAIGTATAVFVLVDSVLIRPLPVTDQQRLAVVWAAEPESGLTEISYPDFLDMRRETRAFRDLAAHGSTPWPLLLTGVGEPVTLPFGAVSGSFFDVLGARAQLGRTLNALDEAPGATRVVVLSHALWQQRFGQDPSVIGRVISLSSQPYEVVGVMPRRFDYPVGSQLWAPLALTLDGLSPDARENLRRIGFLYMVGRLAPGVTPQQATEETTAAMRRLSERYQFYRPDVRAIVTPLVHQVLGPTRPALLLLGTAAGLVLLLGLINVSGLGLVRAASRRAELAIRYALGAAHGDILSLLLAEAMLIGAAALSLAVPIAFISLTLFLGLAPGAAGIQDVLLGARAVAFAGLAGVAAVACLTGQPLLVHAFDSRGRARSLRPARFDRLGAGRQVVIAAEVALTVTVLTAAGLAVKSFWNLRSLDLGYHVDQVLLVETSEGKQQQIREVLAGLPGVRSVGGISLRPLKLGPIGSDVGFLLESQTIEEARGNPALNHLEATPGYFEAMGIRLLSGRFFDERDLQSSARVGIVSDVTARALWGQTDVVGKRLRVLELSPDVPLTTIVGVVGSVRHRELHEARFDFYAPAPDAETWAVRTGGNPAGLAEAARVVLRRLDPHRSIEMTTLRAVVDSAQRPWQLTALVLGTFAVLALLLAATAVHGLVAYAVSLRTNEFGIRIALGARPRDIVWLVTQSTGVVALIGLAAGVPGSIAAARAMRSLLFEVSAFDAASLITALIVLAVSLVAACVVPSRRAALVDPSITLRSQV